MRSASMLITISRRSAATRWKKAVESAEVNALSLPPFSATIRLNAPSSSSSVALNIRCSRK